MAKGKKTGGRDFKKGQSGNPKGPKPMPLEQRMARRLSPTDFLVIANRYFNSTRDEIRAVLEDPNTLAIDLAVISAIKEMIAGDGRMLELLLGRLIGKVSQPLEHSGPAGGPIQIQDFSHLSDEELNQELRQARARLNMAVGDET